MENDLSLSPLAAYGMAGNAPRAPESLAELRDTAQLLRVPEALLATQPEVARRHYLGRALARNPGLMRFASEDLLKRGIAVAYAREGAQVMDAFQGLDDSDPEKLDAAFQKLQGGAGFENKAPGEEKEEEPEELEAFYGDLDSDLDLSQEGPDLYELVKNEPVAPESPWLEESEQSGLDYVLDPFKNFANGFMDLARGVLGMGKSASDLAAGRDSALSRWFADSINMIEESEFRVRRPESFGAQLAQDVVRNAPQLVAQLGTWVYTGAASSLGLIFSEIYGQDYLKYEKKDISPENAAFAALFDASLQTAMEKAGFQALLSGGVLKKLGAQLADAGVMERGAIIGQIAERMGSSAGGQLALAAGRGAAVEGITEAAQHMPEYLADFWAESSLHNNSLADRWDWTLGRVADAQNLIQGTKDALYEGLVGAILGAPVGAGHAAVIRRKLNKSLDPEMRALMEAESNNFQNVVRRLEFENAMQKAREAVAGIKDKEQARAIIRSSLPQGFQQGWLAADDLSQILGRDPRRGQEILDATGRSIEEINDALDKGLALEIELASLLSNNEAEARLIQESLRLTQDGPALGAASAYSPDKRIQEVLRILNQEDDLEGFSEDERSQAAAEELHRSKHMSARLDKQIRRLEKEMRDAGLSDLEAQANTALLRAHAMAWWKRFGVDGSLLLENLNVEKARELAQGGRQMDGEEVERAENKDYNPEWLLGERPPRKTVLRGQLALGKAGAIIRLFKNRDISTVGHESGHLFLQDLIKISEQGQENTINKFLEEMDNLFGQDLDFSAELSQELADLRESLGSVPEAFREFANKLLERSKNLAELAESLNKDKAREELPENLDFEAQVNPDVEYAQVRSQATRKLARQARLAAAWFESVEDAREDLRLFAQHAGLSEEQLQMAIKAALDLENNDQAMLKEYTRLHEYTANGFINYLSKGQAPAPKLIPVFGRFRQWLANLWSRYRDSANEELSPQLKGAFDRLLATEQDLRVQEGVDAFIHHEKAFLRNGKMKAEEARSLQALLRRAQAGQLNKGERLRRKKEEKWRRERAKEIYQELAGDPFWLLAEKARFRQEDVIEILGEKRAKELRSARPFIFSKEGSNLEETAAEAGFDNPEAMLEQLYERLAVKHESRRGQAEVMVEQELLARREQEGELPFPINPDLENYLEYAETAVARIAARIHLKNEREVEKWVDNSRVPQQIIDNMALMRLENTPLRQLTPKNLERLLNRALAKRDRLLESGEAGDLMEALNQANEARVIYAMMAEASRAHKLLAKIRKFGRKIADAKPGTHAALETEALRQLLEAYGLGTVRTPNDLALSNRALQDLVKEISERDDVIGSMPAFPDWLLERRLPTASGRAKNSVIQPQFLTPAELKDLHNLMKFLDKSGRGERGLGINALKLKVNGIVNNCVNAMEELPDKDLQGPGGIKDFMANLSDKGFAAVDILLWQMRKADGMRNILGKGQTGDMERLWGQIVKGEERVRSWLDKVHRAMLPHLRQLEKTRARLEKEYGKKMRLRAIDGSEILLPSNMRAPYKSKYFTPEMIFAIALHTGNVSNWERLLKGYGSQRVGSPIDHKVMYSLFGETRFHNLKAGVDPRNQYPAVKGLLTAQDWRAIQGIWDALALLWPDMKRVNNELYGFSPELVIPGSFDIMKEDGTFERLDGGYFPVRYDGRIDYKVAGWNEQENLLANNEAMFTKPSAKRGYTYARVKEAPGYPIKLDLSPIGEHVNDVSRFIELAPIVRMIDRVTQNPDFKRNYILKFGKEDFDAIRPNLKGLLRSEKLPDIIAWLEQKFRKFVVPWGLSWNPNVALVQSTAIFPAMGDLGAKKILGSISQLVRHPSLRRDIWKASPYMLSRMSNLDQDLMKQLGFTVGKAPAAITYKGKSYSYEDLVDLGMKGIIIVDAAATCTVWLAAYRAKLEELRANPQSAQNNSAQRETGAENNLNPERKLNSESAENTESPAPRTDGNIDAESILNNGQNNNGQNRASQEDGLGNPENGPNSDLTLDDNAPGRRSQEQGAPLEQSQEQEQGPAPDSQGSGLNLIEFENAAHAEAVLYADTIVKQSNPDFDASSRSTFLRSRGMMRLFNQFSSAITLFASRNHYMFQAMQKGKITKARYARHLAYDFLFPAAFLFLFYGILRDFWDKKQTPVTTYSVLFLDQFSMTVPIFGSAASGITQQLMGLGQGSFRRGDLRTSLDAPIELASRGAASIHKMATERMNKEETKAAIYSLLDIASFASRIPFSKVIRRADRGYDQWKRGEGTPASIIIPKPGK